MLVSRESGYNTVYQCRAEIIFILQPCLKIISQVPQICVLLAALQQLLAVVVNQLAGKNNEARQSQLESLVKQLSQLARERMSRSILKLVIAFKADTCLSSVGNDKAEIRVLSQCHVGSIVTVWIHTSGNHINVSVLIYNLTLIDTS